MIQAYSHISLSLEFVLNQLLILAICTKPNNWKFQNPTDRMWHDKATNATKSCQKARWKNLIALSWIPHLKVMETNMYGVSFPCFSIHWPRSQSSNLLPIIGHNFLKSIDACQLYFTIFCPVSCENADNNHNFILPGSETSTVQRYLRANKSGYCKSTVLAMLTEVMTLSSWADTEMCRLNRGGRAGLW